MRALAMLRRKHVAALWVGLCLSSMGDYFYFVAVMWSAAKLAGGAAGLVMASESAAALAFAPLAGVLIDRVDRRRAMIVADLARGAAVLALAGVALRGALGLAQLVAIALVLGVFDSMFMPSLLASIPVLVAHPTELQATNGLIDSTRRLARAVGPTLAGAVAAVVSIAHFFTLDALSFGASAIAVFAVGPGFAWRAERRDASAGRGGVARELRGSWRLVASRAHVAWALGVLFVTNATWAVAFEVGGVLFAERIVATNMSGYAFLIGAYGAGNVAGNLVVGSIHVERRLTTLFASKLVLGAGFLVMAAAPSLPVAMVGAAIAAVGGPMGELATIAMLQTEYAADERGRVFALRLMIEHAGIAAGLIVAAPVFAAAPVRAGIAAAAVTLAASGVAGMARFGLSR